MFAVYIKYYDCVAYVVPLACAYICCIWLCVLCVFCCCCCFFSYVCGLVCVLCVVMCVLRTVLFYVLAVYPHVVFDCDLVCVCFGLLLFVGCLLWVCFL